MIKDINIHKIKFLPISQDNLILALDRLTRFKYPEVKYYRVFSELLCKYLVEPKLSKQQIYDLEVAVLKPIIEIIWNESVHKLVPDVPMDSCFNKVLQDELCNTYLLSENIKNFIGLNININGLLSLIEHKSDLPINLRRLLLIKDNYVDLKKIREDFCVRFPLTKVVLCEGITEEILLPKFAKLAGFDFDKYGVKLLSAGGKNQVAKLYCELKDELKIPIFVLLDADANAIADSINNVLRSIDEVYLINKGEFEDIFSLNLIKRTINNRFKNICESCVADFKNKTQMTFALSEFYRVNELGDFQKAEFAKELAINLKYKTDLTEEIMFIIEKIKNL